MKRLLWLDLYRGFAVVIMIIFHFSYDLNMMNVVHFDFREGFWYYFPRFIAFSFLFCVGCAIMIEHTPKLKTKAFMQRFGKLLGCAALISLGTYLFYPAQWIYFGTLHCIAFCSLLALPFRHHKWALWGAVALILILTFGFGYNVDWLSTLIKKNSMDFIPVYPWLAAVLIGMGVGPGLFSRIPPRRFFGDQALLFLGRHSLVIYLIHQGFLMALAYGISLLIH